MRQVPILLCLLLAGCPPYIHRSGSDWQLVFSPQLDVSSCGGPTWCCQEVRSDPDGTFVSYWPNGEQGALLRVDGSVDDQSFQAALSCANGAGSTGQLTADRRVVSYAGTFELDGQTGGVMVVPTQSDTVALQGIVVAAQTGTPIAGARLSTSLDGQRATTDDYGLFYLPTQTPVGVGTTPYTLTVNAGGYATFSQQSSWGDLPMNIQIQLTPQ